MEQIKLIESKTFLQKLLGLIPYKELKKNEVMVIRKCKSIHTFFMRFPIDLIFVNKEGEIIKLAENVKPGKFCLGPINTKEVYEANTGFIHQLNLKVNENLLDRISHKV